LVFSPDAVAGEDVAGTKANGRDGAGVGWEEIPPFVVSPDPLVEEPEDTRTGDKLDLAGFGFTTTR